MKLPLVRLVMECGYDEKTARSLILAGRVFIKAMRQSKADFPVAHDSPIIIREAKKYPSRAAYKLLGAIRDFNPQIHSRTCIDLGAAHGGFTRVMLDAGAKRVYAIDVAYGIMDYNLRRDEKVVMLERKNVRDLVPDWFGTEDLCDERGIIFVCDLSFISLKSVLDPLADLGRDMQGPLEGIALAKPQFEASNLTEGGIIRNPLLRQEILKDLEDRIATAGFRVLGVRPADIAGAKGNQEYLLHMQYDA